MVDTAEHQRHWDDKYASGSTHADYRADDDLARHIAYAPGCGMALDVACGTGRNSFLLAEHGLDVICIDFSANALHYFKQHRAGESIWKNLIPIQADLTKIPLPGSMFDLVIVVRYLDREAISSYLQALKPGGLLFFKAFNLNHLKRKPDFNPDFLLTPGELRERFEGQMVLHSNDNKHMKESESFALLRQL